MGATLMQEAEIFADMPEIADYYKTTAAFAGAIGADVNDAIGASDAIVAFNARETTDVVLEAFGRAERIIQLARAMYAERPSHAAPMDVPDIEVEMCVMQAIGEASSMVNA